MVGVMSQNGGRSSSSWKRRMGRWSSVSGSPGMKKPLRCCRPPSLASSASEYFTLMPTGFLLFATELRMC
eukprot:929196-Pleurochrysis_carterae.AAC.1